ncbi:MAG: hypothetical protein H7X86_08180 [Gorillibacterium sp.]|nr:hypothetical protein [Gorillibacterium sp.]
MSKVEWHKQAYMNGREYFPIGNGQISGFVQWDRSGLNQPLTLLLQNPEILEPFTMDGIPKQHTYLFNPDQGLDQTALTVTVDGRMFRPIHSNLEVVWKSGEEAPIVVACWWAGQVRIQEQFFVSVENPFLYRTVTVENPSNCPVTIRLELPFVPNPHKFPSMEFIKETDIIWAKGEPGAVGLGVKGNSDQLSVTQDSNEYKAVFAPGELIPRESHTCTFTYILAVGQETNSFENTFKQTRIQFEERQLMARRAKAGVLETDDLVFKHVYDSALRGLMMCMSDSGNITRGSGSIKRSGYVIAA